MSENIRLLNYRDLEKLGFGSRVTIWRKCKEYKFPQPIYLNDHSPRWRESEILKFLELLELEQVS